MKKLAFIFVLGFITLSFGAFAQTSKLQIVTPAIAGGDVVIQPIGGTGHQGLFFNIPNLSGNHFAFGNNNVMWMEFKHDKTVKLDGKLIAAEIEVKADVWSDFVFKPDYKLMPLNELESFIKENNHLPNIPTEAEVKTNGINVAEMNAKLLEKVEELTLYMIALKKDNDILKQSLQKLTRNNK